MEKKQQPSAKLPYEGATPEDNRRPQPEFMAALKKVKRPLILAHVTPDADALGSALGLAMSLQEDGAQPSVGLPAGCVAKRLGFMLRLGQDVPVVEAWNADDGWDALIVVDTAAAKRINIKPVPPLDSDLPTFNIDHHITNTDYAQVQLGGSPCHEHLRGHRKIAGRTRSKAVSRRRFVALLRDSWRHGWFQLAFYERTIAPHCRRSRSSGGGCLAHW